MKIKAHLVKAFTDNPQNGNPAGVILNADQFTDQQMIRISADLGFSESSFVSQSSKADYRVRFFTPKTKVDLCGHATIATFHLLQKELHLQPQVYTQETGAGVLEVEITEQGRVYMKQQDPTFWEPVEERQTIARLLNMREADLKDYPIQLVSTGGAPKLMIPIISLAVLQSINPDLPGISSYCQSSQVRGFYPFTSQTIDPNHDFHARQFNPLAGINEDPITGIAGGALACYAKEHGLTSKPKLVIEQGYTMNKGGEMYIDLQEGVKVGGDAVHYETREIEL